MRLVVAIVLLVIAAPAVAQRARPADTSFFCSRPVPSRNDPARDLYCLDLVPRPDVQGASGIVELARVPSPFDVTVSPEGHFRSGLVAEFAGLPDPRSLGPYRAYVAWIAPPVLDPVRKLGEVRNGRFDLGTTDLDKFIILVSAESSAKVTERGGRLVLRGNSPSTRLARHDLLMLPPEPDRVMNHGAWPMPPMDTTIPMFMPGIDGLLPEEAPYRPGAGRDPASFPAARPAEVLEIADGDTVRLEAGFVRRTIGGQALVMMGYNGQYPGPLLRVRQGSAITVEFINAIDQPSAVHWHGLRLDNPNDGAVGVTQDPVPPGGRFVYRVRFPDAGIYWYHAHVREDIQQDLGLYGNLVVQPRRATSGPVNREQFLILDDFLLGPDGPTPHGATQPIHALMGRFGNVLLVNGTTDYRLDVGFWEVVRFHFTNASNTRTFNLSIPGALVKLVAGDVSQYEREEWVDNVVIAPAQRYVVDVHFRVAGKVPLLNRVQALNHSFGYYFPQVDTLGVVDVNDEERADANMVVGYQELRQNSEVTAEIRRLRDAIARPPDRELVLTLQARDLPVAVEQILQLETSYFSPVEWSGTMPMMDWLATGKQARWILRDAATGKENEAIDWTFRRGDVVKIRLVNDRGTLHGMQHPIHLHGQRFLVLEQNGVPNRNRAWKDTVLLPAGSTADILVEMSNPGRWMVHCHIAEHLQSGMMAVFTVN